MLQRSPCRSLFDADDNGAGNLWAPGATFFDVELNATWLTHLEMANDTEVLNKFRAGHRGV